MLLNHSTFYALSSYFLPFIYPLHTAVVLHALPSAFHFENIVLKNTFMNYFIVSNSLDLHQAQRGLIWAQTSGRDYQHGGSKLSERPLSHIFGSNVKLLLIEMFHLQIFFNS